MEIEYYADGTGRYLASLKEGDNGFFIIYDLKTNPQWNFVIPGSIAWDSLHQNVYRNHHDFDPCTEDEIKLLPELPDIPPYKAMRWEGNFKPSPMPVSDFPETSKLLLSKQNSCRFWFILYEDLYETRLGDGKFIYWARRVYLNKEEAITFIKSEDIKRGEDKFGEEYTLKSFLLKIEDGFLVPENFLPEAFESYKIEKIIRRIEITLASNGKIRWGEEADWMDT